jgi:predicted kinase
MAVMILDFHTLQNSALAGYLDLAKQLKFKTYTASI